MFTCLNGKTFPVSFCSANLIRWQILLSISHWQENLSLWSNKCLCLSFSAEIHTICKLVIFWLLFCSWCKWESCHWIIRWGNTSHSHNPTEEFASCRRPYFRGCHYLLASEACSRWIPSIPLQSGHTWKLSGQAKVIGGNLPLQTPCWRTEKGGSGLQHLSVCPRGRSHHR